MRVLLDGCVPWRLGGELAGHEVHTVQEMGWADLDDGPLLDAMAGGFDFLVTVDKSIPDQQQTSSRPFAIVVLRAKSNRLADLLPRVTALRLALEEMTPGQVTVLTD